MERRVTVNDRIERLELEVPDGVDLVDDVAADVEDFPGRSGPGPAGYGPCLYLGSRGERCATPALEGGYCAKHHTDPAMRPPGRSYARVIVATIALAVTIWPYVADVVRGLIHWLSSIKQ